MDKGTPQNFIHKQKKVTSDDDDEEEEEDEEIVERDRSSKTESNLLLALVNTQLDVLVKRQLS